MYAILLFDRDREALLCLGIEGAERGANKALVSFAEPSGREPMIIFLDAKAPALSSRPLCVYTL